MPDRSKGRGEMKCSSWSSRLWVGRGANDPNPEKYTVTKPHRIVASVKKNTPDVLHKTRAY
jgi:hypothetical protein